jgi:hypothetical protein
METEGGVAEVHPHPATVGRMSTGVETYEQSVRQSSERKSSESKSNESKSKSKSKSKSSGEKSRGRQRGDPPPRGEQREHPRHAVNALVTVIMVVVGEWTLVWTMSRHRNLPQTSDGLRLSNGERVEVSTVLINFFMIISFFHFNSLPKQKLNFLIITGGGRGGGGSGGGREAERREPVVDLDEEVAQAGGSARNFNDVLERAMEQGIPEDDGMWCWRIMVLVMVMVCVSVYVRARVCVCVCVYLTTLYFIF